MILDQFGQKKASLENLNRMGIFQQPLINFNKVRFLPILTFFLCVVTDLDRFGIVLSDFMTICDHSGTISLQLT